MHLYFSDIWLAFLLLALGSYMVGNISFARLIAKSKNKDITKLGSGNPGTLNISRNFGIKTGILTLVLDGLKGAIPALVGYLVFKNKYFGDSTLEVSECALFIAGFCAVLGHVFPVVYKFKGGKGIATTIGVFFVAEWQCTLIFVIIAFIYILVTEMGAMGSFIATTPSAIASLIKIYNLGFKDGIAFDYGITFFIITNLLIVGIILLTWYAHRANIKRLLAGEEHETGWIDMIRNIKIKRKQKRLAKKNEKDGVDEEQSKNSAENT